MPLDPASQYLVTTLEGLALLGGRFRNLKLVNYDPASGKQRGCFSLVFRGEDTTDGKTVAVKFFDIASTADVYRLRSFERESEILESLQGADRCLQLIQPTSTYTLQIPGPSGGAPLPIPCRYFVVEWLDQDVDRFFLEQDKIDSIEKLLLWNDVALAVEALHRRDVFHRDLKFDNLRMYTKARGNGVTAIDLGAAARADSDYLRTDYSKHVGAPAWAAPEALCGLSGNRTLARYNDIYASGCLLFELFNRDLFYSVLRARNPQFDMRLLAMSTGIPAAGPGSDDPQIAAWNNALAKFGHGVTSIRVDAPGNSAELAIQPILNDLVSGMTHFDYRRRLTLGLARQKLWIAIRILRHQREAKKRLALRKLYRQRRLEKLAALEQRARQELLPLTPKVP